MERFIKEYANFKKKSITSNDLMKQEYKEEEQEKPIQLSLFGGN